LSEDRHSEAESVELITDPYLKAQREAENGVRQFKHAIELIGQSITPDAPKFKLKQSAILELHEKALEGIHPLAGTYRNSPVQISKSKHQPPRHSEIPDLVAEMCDYVNTHWDDQNAVHLAAYLLWRINWIHPFADGNGRTARVVSYLVMSVKLHSVLPGAPAMPELLASDKSPYYQALEESDESWSIGRLALSSMEQLLEGLLAAQLLSATNEATH
jgi:Fic family protein